MPIGIVPVAGTRAPSSMTSASGGEIVNRNSVTVVFVTSSNIVISRGDTWPVST